MLQIFGAGTACVVSPVGRILYKNKTTHEYEELLIPTMESQPNVMQRLYDTIIDIQVGLFGNENYINSFFSVWKNRLPRLDKSGYLICLSLLSLILLVSLFLVN